MAQKTTTTTVECEVRSKEETESQNHSAVEITKKAAKSTTKKKSKSKSSSKKSGTSKKREVDSIKESTADAQENNDSDLANDDEFTADDEFEQFCKTTSPSEIGRRGELAAASFLTKSGYEILERNWECPAGEADIIARDEETLVFCEVKTRTSLEKGLPSDAVDEKKRNRYERIAGWYLRDYEFVDVPVRFDIIALLVVGNDRALVRHYINAFGVGL